MRLKHSIHCLHGGSSTDGREYLGRLLVLAATNLNDKEDINVCLRISGTLDHEQLQRIVQQSRRNNESKARDMAKRRP